MKRVGLRVCRVDHCIPVAARNLLRVSEVVGFRILNEKQREIRSSPNGNNDDGNDDTGTHVVGPYRVATGWNARLKKTIQQRKIVYVRNEPTRKQDGRGRGNRLQLHYLGTILFDGWA